MVTTQDKGREVTTARKATETSRRVRGMVKAMYRAALDAQAEGKPRAYAFVVGLFDEILIAMDVTPIWIENYAGLCAAKRDVERFISKSDNDGFAGALCTYCTVNIGFDALRADSGEIPTHAPDGGMATPTMMIGTGSTGCDPRHKLFQTLRRYHKDVPVYVQNLILPSPTANIKEVQDYYVKYMVEELKGLVEFMEKQTGRKMDWDKLNEIIDIANETYRLRYEIDVIREAVPSPMPMQDAMRYMGIRAGKWQPRHPSVCGPGLLRKERIKFCMVRLSKLLRQ